MKRADKIKTIEEESKKAKTGYAKAGQPTKFTETLQRQAEILAKKGFTDVELAEALLVTEATITNWKKAHPKFFVSLKDWKAEADAKVERSLYERACGYKHPEDKIFNDGGEPMIVPTIKEYPPDTTAAIFWLKNRKKSEWRDKTETDLNVSGPMVIEVKHIGIETD